MKQNNSVKRIKAGKIVLLIAALIAHILVAVFAYLCSGYYALSKETMIALLGAVIVLLMLADGLIVISINHKDKLATVISSVIIGIMIIASGIGTFMLIKVNAEVNKVIDNAGTEQYETVYISYVSYDKEYSDVKDFDGLTVGYIYGDEQSVGSIGKAYLEENGIKADFINYSSQDDLFFALIDGEVDVAIMPSAYQQKYSTDTNIDYSEHLEKCHLIYSFEKEVKTGENNSSDKDLTIEPFNILLIGYAPENDSYGLSDTIILATVNPQTLTVGLTSIARDSYVPIACYSGGGSDKINAARGVSRQCLMDTVSNLLDVDVDFYVEVNFKGLVEIVDAVGGIPIYSEEAFVGQTSSTERGEYVIEIPEGWYWANGEEALSFARERYAFSDGDFARQRHQKQVILAIAEQVLSVRSVSTLMDVMEAAGNNLSTNLSLDQITSLFNYLMSIDTDSIGVDIMNIINFEDMRVTGYASWHYNEKVHLPLWIYKLYQGSIDETKENINNILNLGEIEVERSVFSYYTAYPYYLPQYYSETFDEIEVHEVMPNYYPNLTNMTYDEALEWANGVGVTFEVTETGTDGYAESLWGTITKQSVSYGQLVSDYPTCQITVIGEIGEKVPNFVDDYYEVAAKWATDNGYTTTVEVISTDSASYDMSKAGKVISQTPKAKTTVSSKGGVLNIKYYDYFTINATTTFVNTAENNTLTGAKAWITKYMKYPDSVVYKAVASVDESLYKTNKIKSAAFVNNGTSSNTGLSNAKTLVITYYVKAESFEIKAVSDNESYGTVTGSGTYSNVGSATITATPKEGYKFIGWYEDTSLVSDQASYTFSVTKAVTYTAKFEARTSVTITVSVNDTTMGSASADKTTVYSGDPITLTATPDSAQYVFVKWSDGNTSASRTVNPTENTTYTAEFKIAEYTITVTNGTGGGTYAYGTSVTIAATVPDGSTFTQWSDGDTNATRTITVTGNQTFEAQYSTPE